MFTNKRNVLTAAAVIATLTMATGVSTVALQQQHTAATAAPATHVIAAPAVSAAYQDDMGGGDR
jgi:hypothetical protein